MTSTTVNGVWAPVAGLLSLIVCLRLVALCCFLSCLVCLVLPWTPRTAHAQSNTLQRFLSRCAHGGRSLVTLVWRLVWIYTLVERRQVLLGCTRRRRIMGNIRGTLLCERPMFGGDEECWTEDLCRGGDSYCGW